MLKAVQCKECGYAMTVEKLGQDQQVACPSCSAPVFVQAGGIDKNTILGERYQVKQIISENSISVVYLATDLEVSDFILLRVFSWNFSQSVSQSDEFLQMISSVSHLAEPAHVRIIDYGLDDGLIFTVWSYEDMEPVRAIVTRNGPLSPAMALSICKDLALSLDKAYYSSGVGHFNLTPECIYMNSQGVVKYSDFGISAQLSNDQRFMQSGVSYWDISFMSPEMALGWSYPDIKSDMYSLATVLYYLITGSLPHGGLKNSQEINYDGLAFPPQLEAILDRKFLDMFYSMVARNPAQRYVSWSEVVSKMDQLLYEEKMKKSSYSQRHRATLTRSFKRDMFENIEVAPKLPNRRRGNVSQKRMSAEDVKKRLSHKGAEVPVTFGKTSSSASASGRRPAAKKRRGTSGGRKQLSNTTTNAPILKRNSDVSVRKKEQEAEAEKSRLSVVMVLFGILFGVVMIFFVMKAALGSDKKVRLASKVPEEEREVSKQEWKDKLPPLPDPPPESELDSSEKARLDEEPLQTPKPELSDKEKNRRLKDLIKKLFKTVPDKKSDVSEVQKDLTEAEELAQGNDTILETINKLNEEFAPRKKLAVRLALTDVTQEVRNLQLIKDYDGALKVIEDYKGPYATELQDDIFKLKNSVLKSKGEPTLSLDNQTSELIQSDENMEQQPAEGALNVVAATGSEVALNIAKGLTDAALNTISRLPDPEKEGIDVDYLKSLLEKASDKEIISFLTKGYQKEQQSKITIRHKGQTLSGTLAYVDEEVNTLRMAVVISGREIFRIADIKDIYPEDNLPRLNGATPSETSFLRMIYSIRSGRVSKAIQAFEGYTGPLEAEIKSYLANEVDEEAESAFKKISDLLGLPEFSSESFMDSLNKINYLSEDAWLATYMLQEVSRKYANTDFYQFNQNKSQELSKILSKLTDKISKATVVVSQDGRTGTKNLETAIREARSGEIIRILPGQYEGTFDIRQKSVQILGTSGTILKSPLRINEKGVVVKGIVQPIGDLKIGPEVGNIQIINCRFGTGGINMAGDNSSIIINNVFMRGLTLGENKRLSIKNSTIVDNKTDRIKDHHFCVRGFITGEVNNCVIYSDANYALKFKESDKSSTSFKNSIIFGSSSVAYANDSKETINTEKDFKKSVGRISNVMFERPTFENPSKGDYRIKEFTPGHLQGEDKKSMGVQMDANLKFLNVE